MQVLPVCTGEGWKVLSEGVLSCAGTIQALSLESVAVPFSMDMVDPVIVAQSFVAGFGLFVTFWSAGKGISILLSQIKRK